MFGFVKHRGVPLNAVAAVPGYLRRVLDTLPLLDDAKNLAARTLAAISRR